MQIEKGPIWIKTITKGVVCKIHRDNEILDISEVKEITLFIQHSKSRGVTMLLVYVDNISHRR